MDKCLRTVEKCVLGVGESSNFNPFRGLRSQSINCVLIVKLVSAQDLLSTFLFMHFALLGTAKKKLSISTISVCSYVS